MSTRFFKSLLLRSASLQREIEAEYARPKPDSLRLLRLKKLKLLVKDRLHRLMRTTRNSALVPAMARNK